MFRDYRKTPEYLAITGQIDAAEYLARYGDLGGEVRCIEHAAIGKGKKRHTLEDGQDTGASECPIPVPD